MNALVTGATGFIGRHLVDRLLALGASVSVLVRPGRDVPAPWRGRVALIECPDLTSTGLRRAVAAHSFESVFHLAAYGVAPTERDPDPIMRVNVELPSALVRLCRERGANLIMTGTFSEYARPAGEARLTEQSPLQSAKIYGSSKAAGGLLAAALAAELDVRFRLLRLFKVYGAGEAPHRLLPNLIASLRHGRRVALSAGTQVLDFVYVKDAVDACVRADADMAAQARAASATWNVCTGKGHSVRAFASTVAKVLGAPADLLGFGDIAMRPDDEPWLVGSPERMYADTGWRTAYDLDTGVGDAVAILTTGSCSIA
jgi:nucleoside-diphosphate-sugar epimerase